MNSGSEQKFDSELLYCILVNVVRRSWLDKNMTSWEILTEGKQI